ncbi:J domain-containing protein [Prochlorococcus sp. MIT 1341]|uniref:J domain-containing protein n=1 Tax=Prochlorococcus sp. MIT 1341 TaxID=3096221 RepID=UPI002A75176E|nr:J domain-containing protein [Prochlorococcus sp. MIT 1341]
MSQIKPDLVPDQDPYEILGVSPVASTVELKAAYRDLAKKYHPDAGGDVQKILQLNAAWEIIGDAENRRVFDRKHHNAESLHQRSARNARASTAAKEVKENTVELKGAVEDWLKDIYTPVDRLLGLIINPLPRELRALSADPYDDSLMDSFVGFLAKSRHRIEKVNTIYRSKPVPSYLKEFGLSLYQCLAQVEDGLSELERYTMGYVDGYLHDGREMLSEAKKRRSYLKGECRRLKNL